MKNKEFWEHVNREADTRVANGDPIFITTHFLSADLSAKLSKLGE